MTRRYVKATTEEVGENWLMAYIGADDHDKVWLVTTDHIRGSDTYSVLGDLDEPEALARFIADAINNELERRHEK